MAGLKSVTSILLLLTALLAAESYAADNKATQILKMASAMLYRAPAGNGYVRAFEVNKFDVAYKLIRTNAAMLATQKCGKRKRDVADELLYNAEEPITADVPDSDLLSAQQTALRMLDTEKGQRLVVEHLPTEERPKVFTDEEKVKRAAKTLTWTYYIPSGNLNGKSKASVLLARVRNAMKNIYSFRLLNLALVDGTARKALQSLSTCSNRLKYSQFINQRG